MSWTLRITEALVKRMRRDLQRRHEFAGERVGFLMTKIGNQHSANMKLVLGVDYWPVPDDSYINDPSVGARYEASVHRGLMERAHAENLGMFHVHAHEHGGCPHFSGIDLDCIEKLVPSLRTVQPRQAHGALLFSHDDMAAACWLPEKQGPAGGGRVVVVGRPIWSRTMEEYDV